MKDTNSGDRQRWRCATASPIWLGGRRGPTGPVGDAVFLATRAHGYEPARSDRRSGLTLRTFPVVILAARGAPRRFGP
jgi:hypothetical protein